MIKILYAADNRESSKYSLQRFVETYKDFFVIKVAAYTKSSIDFNTNWNLDALLDFRSKSHRISFTNSNYPLFVREVKRFAPDLVISDLEPYSSYAAIELNIPLWQVSPMLLYYGTTGRHNLDKYYSGDIKNIIFKSKEMERIVKSSRKKLIPSHFGDLENSPALKEGYEWIRPNYQSIETNSHIINVSSNATSLADCYYSLKTPIMSLNYNDMESVMFGNMNYKYNLGSFNIKKEPHFDLHINENVKFLSQHLKKLDI